MIDTRLILLEGITGTGKSTTAQNLFVQLHSEKKSPKWFHEEENGHPLYYPDWNIQWIRTTDKLSEFINNWPHQWKSLYGYCNKNILILTSYLFQDGARVLFANNMDKEFVFEFVKNIVESIKDLKPVVIFLYTRDTVKTLENLWIKRGRAWMKYIYGVDEQTPFAKSRNLKGTTASMILWGKFQNLCREMFQFLDIEKIEIDVTDCHWKEYQERISKKLELDTYIYPSVDLDHSESYCGFFISNKHETLSCRIRLDNGAFVCDFIWPDLKLIPQTKTRFWIQSFPLQFVFSNNTAGKYETIVIEGADIYGLNGRVFKRV